MVYYDFINLLVWFGVFAVKYIAIVAIAVCGAFIGVKFRQKKNQKLTQ